jgi:hypothetical protein
MSYKIIEDCLAELANNQEARDRFNLVSNVRTFINDDKSVVFWDGGTFESWSEDRRCYIVLTLLSRTPNDKAVMEFLDVENPEIQKIKNISVSSSHPCAGDISIEIIKMIPQTLQSLLLQEFTKVCFGEGKGFEEALKVIDQIYINNLKK